MRPTTNGPPEPVARPNDGTRTTNLRHDPKLAQNCHTYSQDGPATPGRAHALRPTATRARPPPPGPPRARRDTIQVASTSEAVRSLSTSLAATASGDRRRTATRHAKGRCPEHHLILEPLMSHRYIDMRTRA